PDALRMAEKAVALAPGDTNILDTQAECYARLGDYKKAVEIEKQALTKANNPEFEQKIRDWKKKKSKPYNGK
ncbi:MAG TPA: hypothetical protein VMF29_09390, partial [Candidatus Edwardsbacteria bacterium]|nr:hypothetical protein [Candidatus Edwardsbacteria bacterium]